MTKFILFSVFFGVVISTSLSAFVPNSTSMEKKYDDEVTIEANDSRGRNSFYQ